MSSDAEISSATEIVFLLRQLIKNKELFSVSFGQGRDSMSTLLLEVSPEKGMLVFDGSSDPAVNQKVVAGGRLQFSGNLRGVKVQFAAMGCRSITYQGAAALVVKIPEHMLHHQNRAAFRVKAKTPSYCRLALPGGGKLKVPIDELSVGGVQLILGYDARTFPIGQKLPGCEIELGAGSVLLCQLEVRSNKQITSRFSGLRSVGMGCRFVGLSKGDEARVSRFVAQQERQALGKDSPFSL